MLTETSASLGPATVVAAGPEGVRILRPEGEVLAQSALAYPYRPEPGDVVLAIGEEDVYVIGVLYGRGKTVFDAPGDLELRAKGRVAIVGEQAVEVRSPEIHLHADRMETFIRTVFERTVDCYRWVKNLLQTSAGRSRTVVEESATLQADRIVEVAKKDVRIDGERIHLG